MTTKDLRSKTFSEANEVAKPHQSVWMLGQRGKVKLLHLDKTFRSVLLYDHVYYVDGITYMLMM